MPKQSNPAELARELGQLDLAACDARRGELLAAVNGARPPARRFPTGTPTVVLLRALGRASSRRDVVDDLDAVAGRVAGEAPPLAELGVGVLPGRAGGEAALTHC